MSLGTTMAGGVVARTVTLKLRLEEFPRESLAEQVTAVVPRANVEPEAGAQDGVTAPSTRSDALAVYSTTAPDAPVASAVMSLGTTMAGGVVSRTVTLNVALEELPC